MNELKITIVDYGMGNLRSVGNALRRVGSASTISSDPADVVGADALVLPGVGAFGEAMRNLEAAGLDHAIRSAVDDGVPLLGICLGMQLLAESSEERGSYRGLGIVPGHVRRVPAPSLRLPHMGWNTLTFPRPDVLFDGIEPESAFYFVHTYELEADAGDVIAVSDYGGSVVSAVRRGHVAATQFHPERSQTKGILLLGNFVRSVHAGASARC